MSTDEPSECVFDALVIGRAWCTAREEIGIARHEESKESVDRALKAIDEYEKQVQEYSTSGRYSRCTDAISGRFSEGHREHIKHAKELVKEGNFFGAQDELSESL